VNDLKNKDNTIQLPVKTIAISAMLLISAFLLIPCTVLAEGGFAGGSGTEEDPWLIATPEQLATVAEEVYCSSHFKLIDHIDLSDYLSDGGGGWNEGAGWKPIGTYDMFDPTKAFTGSFDGDGYTISSLFINRSDTEGVGLFGYTNDATIKDVILDNAYITGDACVGSLVGVNENCTISGCSAENAEVTGFTTVGGLVGSNDSGNIANSLATAEVSGVFSVGGLVGDNYGGSIESSYATGTVSGIDYDDPESQGHFGGLAGRNYIYGTIENSYSTGNVAGIHLVGGLVGSNTDAGVIENSYSTGDAAGTAYVGGLVGCNSLDDESYDNPFITDCYAAGSVEGEQYVGGLVGQNCEGDIVHSFSIGEVSGTNKVGGLVGNNDGGAVTDSFYDSNTSGQSDEGKGERKSTAEMNAYTTFFNSCWDFIGETGNGEDDIWGIDESADGPVNDGYPFLTWQGYDHKVWPAVSTIEAEDIADIFAVGQGEIIIIGYPNPTQHGVVWSSHEDPTLEDNKTEEGAVLGAGSFTSEITGLEPETTYYVRAYATNDLGTVYGEQISFTTEEGTFAGGNGLPENPYQIQTADQLAAVSEYMDKHFVLTADIYLYAYGEEYDDGAGWLPIGNYDNSFTGSFDGNGHTITGLYINRPDTYYVGIFGCTGADAEISNLRLLDVNVVGDGYVGALVGENHGTITGSCAAGSVEGSDYVGGLVGRNGEVATCSIIDCYSAVNVVGAESVGGLAGGNEGTITGSYATGDVVGEGYIGGLTGGSGTDYRCTITDSYATGNVTGTYNVGGLTGQNFNCDIENSYATGSVTGSNNVGGLVGINEADGTVTSSYYDTETTGQTDGGKGVPKTTAEMKQQGSFVGWDFSDIWNLAGGTYPYLEWQTDNFDFAPPVFTVGYPKTEDITYEGMDILVQVDEVAAAYYVVLANGVDAPDAAQVKAGMDSENTVLAENLKGSIAGISAGTDGRAVITGLAPGTEYDIYVVAEDNAGNMQPDGSVALLEACTGLMPTGNMSFALTTPVPEADGNSIAVDQSSPKIVDVDTVNGIGSVEITGTKTAAQSVTVGGVDADKVTAAGEATEPVYTIDTSAIAAEGGTYEFTLTVSEAGKADIVYNVTVTVAVPDNTPPVPGNGGTITVSNITHNSLELSWAAASDDVTAQQNLQYKVVRSESNNIDTAINAESNGTIVKDWTAGLTGTEASGLSAETIYYFNVIVQDEAGNMAVYTMKSQAAGSVPEREDEDDRDEDDRSERNVSGISPVYNAVIKGSNTSGTTITVNVNTRRGSAAVNLGEQFEDVSNGEEVPVITIPSIPGVNAYTVGIPADSLSGSQSKDILTFSTPEGSITLPGNMLAGIAQTGSKGAGITIGEGDKSLLPDDVKAALGDRPLVQLSLTLDGNQAEWNNPDAPVTVSIPYKPTAAELSDPEHIVIWYIDGSGNVVEVPSGRYNPETGMVTFSTTHFSHYAVAYVTKSFNDLGSAAWAKKPIEVLASKGILKGISETEYAPQEKITRADFLYYLVRALGVDAKVDGNFGDISREAYYYKEIAVAKKLGITGGTGNNKFSPDESITRQDMMVLTERALRMLKKLEVQGSASDLDRFADKTLIAAYATDSIASVVREELIVGSGDRINPLGSTTRAEAAVFLYRIYNRF